MRVSGPGFAVRGGRIRGVVLITARRLFIGIGRRGPWVCAGCVVHATEGPLARDLGSWYAI